MERKLFEYPYSDRINFRVLGRHFIILRTNCLDGSDSSFYTESYCDERANIMHHRLDVRLTLCEVCTRKRKVHGSKKGKTFECNRQDSLANGHRRYSFFADSLIQWRISSFRIQRSACIRLGCNVLS